MRNHFFALLALGFAAGCESLQTGRQVPLSAGEEERLRRLVLAPEELGIELVDSGGRKTARWKELSYPAEPVTVPLLPADSRHSAQPAIAARLNGGSPVPLVVDTGAPVTLIHASVALKNNVGIADPEKLRSYYQGLAGDERTYFGLIRQMAAGDLLFRNVFTAIRTQSYERRFLGLVPHLHWEGNLIGMSSLFRFAYLTLDYHGRKVTLSSREWYTEPQGSLLARVPFELKSAQVLVDLRVDATNQFKALVDTGNDAPLMMSSNLVWKTGYQSLAEAGKKGKYVGLGGEMETRTFTLPRVEFGGVTFTNVATVSGPESFGVVLGSGFLKEYKTTFDFRRKILWLEK